MNSSKIPSIVIMGLFLLYAFYIVVNALAGGGNALSGMLLGLFPICVVACFFSEHIKWFLLIFLACFGDLLKRVLILYGSFDLTDISAPLSLAPVVLFTILALTFLPLIRATQRDKRYILIFLFCVLWALIAIVSLAREGGLGLKSIQELINIAGYVNLCWAVPVVLRERKIDAKFLLRTTLAVLSIVIIYGIIQSIFGMSKFEEDYILSGFTGLLVHYDPIWMRPFSTLSSIHAYTVITSISLSALVIYGSVAKMDGKRVSKFLFIAAFILFATGMLTGLGRAAWLAFAITLISGLAFRVRLTTAALYTCGVLMAGILVWKADDILYNMADYQDSVEAVSGETTTRTGRALQVNTYSERLMGFRNIVDNKNMRTMFGVSDGKMDPAMFSHDPLTSALRDYGFVPVGFAMAIFILIVIYLHKKVFNLRLKQQRRTVCWLMAAFTGVVVSGALTGNHLHLVPVNLFTWMFVGMFLYFLFEWKPDDRIPAPDSPITPPLRGA